MKLFERVAARYLAAQEDVGSLLGKYRELLTHYASYEETAKKWLQAYRGIERLKSMGGPKAEMDALRGTYMEVQRSPTTRENLAGGAVSEVAYDGRSGDLGKVASYLSLLLLQQLKLPPKLQKAIQASAKWGHGAVRMPKGQTREETSALGLEVYLKHLEEFRKYEGIFEEALRVGTGKTTELVKAGPFTINNMRGYPDDIVQGCAEVLVEAGRKMQGIGMGKVCYGEVALTPNLHGSSGKNDLAYYVEDQDTLYVILNLASAPTEAVRYVCHELAHRFVARFLASEYGLSQLYEQVESTSKFVTGYAKMGGPEENFCEMVSFHAMGKLPADQVELLESFLR